MMNYNLSLTFAFMSNAQPNECYCNAWEVVAHHLESGFYIEGWTVLEVDREVQLIEHGWVKLDDGTIIDPSIIFIIGPDTPIRYFPGVTYSRHEALAFEGLMLPQVRFTRYGNDGMLHPEYKKAFEDAHAHARGLSNEVVVYTVKYEEERIR
jgi:hypothetical protein